MQLRGNISDPFQFSGISSNGLPKLTAITPSNVKKGLNDTT